MIPSEEAIKASAKMGIGIEDILEAVIERVPPPSVREDRLLRASVFDSVFDSYRGVIVYAASSQPGSLKRGMGITMYATNRSYEIEEVKCAPETAAHRSP